jgi:hypothetical protein
VVEYIAVQKKPLVNLSPDCIALTTKRIIFLRPKNLGLSMAFPDYIWKDIADCHMNESMFGAQFSLQTINGDANQIDYLPKAQARKLYAIAQEQEEKQREYRRQLDLEEKRAAAGNITVSAGQSSPQAPTQQAGEDDPIASLKKLKSMFENDLITQQEFDTKKAEILARI